MFYVTTLRRLQEAVPDVNLRVLPPAQGPTQSTTKRADQERRLKLFIAGSATPLVLYVDFDSAERTSVTVVYTGRASASGWTGSRPA